MHPCPPSPSLSSSPSSSPTACFLPGRSISPHVSQGSYKPPEGLWFPTHSPVRLVGTSPSHQLPKGETKVWAGTCSRVPMSQRVDMSGQFLAGSRAQPSL